MFVSNAATHVLTLLDPEVAHSLTIRAMTQFGAPLAPPSDPILKTSLGALEVPNPLGMAAGFDKHGEVPDALLDMGFGFVEFGAVTPRPQPGNARPRVFRLRADQGVINRYGFNSDGLDVVAARLSARARRGIVGVNLGANKDSDDRVEDYVKGIKGFAGLVDFFTVNISSPNTPGLRALQDQAALRDLIDRASKARDEHAPGTALFLKVAPDLTDEDKEDIAALVRESDLDALIVSNTTIERPATLSDENKIETGGLSGRPLFERSTKLLAEFYEALDGEVPLIGVGGVASAHDAYQKIRAGAVFVQLYTALVYQGPKLVVDILNGLPALLRADGFTSVADAVGADHR